MILFYSDSISGERLRLSSDEASHCVQVLRHRPGDRIEVIDGKGTLYHCVLLGAEDTATRKKGPSEVFAQILSKEEAWGSHPYHLTLAVCPTKNIDRYEWMAEKATELGIDVLVPLIGERSERKVLKLERLQRILLSAAKQSLKGAIPLLPDPQSVIDFVQGFSESFGDSSKAKNCLKLIAYCSDEVQARSNIMEELARFFANTGAIANGSCTPSGSLASAGSCLQDDPCSSDSPCAQSDSCVPNSTCTPKHNSVPKIVVLIGPEGDFSPEEVRAAMAAGFIPVSLGSSRLRTETAALTAAEAVYLSALLYSNSEK